MYSPTIRPYNVAYRFFKSQNDILEEQEFFNSVIGVTHTVKDAIISDEQYLSCLSNNRMQTHAESDDLTTMGVDIGKTIHYEICQWWVDPVHTSADEVNTYADCRLIMAGEVDRFEQLDLLMFNYKIKYAIVDVAPETRKAIEFANRFHGYVRLCRYNHHIQSKIITSNVSDDLIIAVNRTSWLDLSLGRFKTKKIQLPMDLPRDYQKHIKAQVRVPKRERDGNPGAFYETPGNMKDHYGHARNYCEVALPFACGYGPITNVEKVN